MTQHEFFERFRYDIETDLLGGGGFGKVYKAFDEVRNRYVALKVSQVHSGQENLSLQKEVQLAEELPEHKHIAHYESCHRFKMPNGLFDYGILQYYPEGNLSQLIRKKSLSDMQKDAIARGILSGLDHLHRHNVVHRDLKSSNILMATGYQGEYVPKIADFGLSKQFAETDKSYFSNSFAGGSLLYVAPEQLQGGEIRKNVDLWSLGVVLHELVTGRVPFLPTVDSGSETARAEIVRKITTAALPADLGLVPQPWRRVIEACLVPDPAHRVKRVEDVMDILDGAIGPSATGFTKTSDVSDIPTEVAALSWQPGPNPGPLEEEKRRSMWWLWILASLLIAGVLIFLLWPEDAPNESEAEQNQSRKIIQSGGKYGYAFMDGRIAITPRFDEASEFLGALALVRSGDSTYYIDLSGRIVDLVSVQSSSSSQQSYKDETVQQQNSADKKSAEETAWTEAKNRNTIAGYNEFLSQYPSGINSVGARSRIHDLEAAAKPRLDPVITRIENNMVRVAGGTFIMGCTSEQGEDCWDWERPAHEVSLDGFLINKYEVTQAEWRAVMGSDPPELYFEGCDSCPVDGVGWEDVQVFIRKLNGLTGRRYRLPTEAEWEYAARGGRSGGTKYSGSDNLASVGWYDANSGGRSHAVGDKSPNRLGLYDMSGNLWEWCSDYFGTDYYNQSPARNPLGPRAGANWVVRGSCWANDAQQCRVSYRSLAGRNNRLSTIGFRLASD